MLLCAALLSQPATAQDDIAQGRLLAYTCMGCHGIEGYRNAYPSYKVPKIGGQRAAYIEAALIAYRDGDREHPTMQAQGGSLSDVEIRQLAAYFSALSSAEDSVDADDVAGVDAAAICVTCHGTNGAGVVPQPPTLSGQHVDYLTRALQRYRDGARSGNVMAAFAASLTDDDIQRLADLYSSQVGLQTPVGRK